VQATDLVHERAVQSSPEPGGQQAAGAHLQQQGHPGGAPLALLLLLCVLSLLWLLLCMLCPTVHSV
jgi:hypothetical protein